MSRKEKNFMPVSWQEVLQMYFLEEILSIFDGNLQVKIAWKLHQLDMQEKYANKKFITDERMLSCA